MYLAKCQLNMDIISVVIIVQTTFWQYLLKWS